MRTQRRFSIYHGLVCGFAFCLLTVGFSFLASLIKPNGVIASFDYWQHAKPPSWEEYQQMEAARLYSGIGAMIGLLASFISSIILDRRIGYRWLNSLLAFGVFISVSFCLKEINRTPQVLLIYASRLLHLSAIPAYALFGCLSISAGLFVFLINKGKIFKPARLEPDHLSFQFEEETETKPEGMKLT
ncbi:MAG: hypothetical protein EOP48_22470 [Sphingobacteriales bacterium]|nr:MAG: hypothetical protein EOP48_22470 [Sphingobacteriales bacterium]